MPMKRIEAIASFIHPYRFIADVGCDHGLLIKTAFEKYDILFAQAIDNKKAPLESAKQNLAAYQDNVLFTLGDGITCLDDRIEVIVIAGIGGIRIVNILKNIIQYPNIKRIIIQANTDIPKIRTFAQNNSFTIVSEKMIEELSMIYEIIVLQSGFSRYTLEEITFGPHLLAQKSPLFIKKWKKIYQKYNQIDTSAAKEKCSLIASVLGKDI